MANDPFADKLASVLSAETDKLLKKLIQHDRSYDLPPPRPFLRTLANTVASNVTGASAAYIVLDRTDADENYSIGARIGGLTVVGGTGTYTFTVLTDLDNKFDTTGVNGVDFVTDAALNHEAAASHPVTIRADNGAGSVIDTPYTITVNDIDEIAPTISSLSPADGATGVVVSANFVMTFSEAIAAGATANFYLTKTSGSVLIEQLTEADFGTKLVVSGDTLTINWTSNLDALTAYYVEWDAGSVTDIAGNPLAASSGSTQWNITTVAAPVGGTPTFHFLGF
jgi:methionine-rich copper-binding protein CopC